MRTATCQLRPKITIEVEGQYLVARATAPDGYRFFSGGHQIVESWGLPARSRDLRRSFMTLINDCSLELCPDDCACREKEE